jgi:putative 4-mercaptohistidine N1-methyltranferase
MMAETMYETDEAVSQYCEAHYGRPYFGVENFPARCARISLEHMQGRPKKRALDLGCAVGRATFELARAFEFVSGLDSSARFIRLAVRLREKGLIGYQLVEEGDIVSCHERRLSDFGLEGVRERVEFFQADALNLEPRFDRYDLLLAANLIDRLSDPGKFLGAIHARVNSGGLLVLASPYTWLEQFTGKSNWPGGFKKEGEPYTSLQGLRDLLEAHFCMLAEPRDVEFIIRETSRKFQHTVSQMTFWERID